MKYDEVPESVLQTEESDLERVLRHELRHTFFDAESKTPYKLIDHDFEEFNELGRFSVDREAVPQFYATKMEV